MNTEELVNFAEAAISRQMGVSMNDLQKFVLRECCQDQKKTYDRIASECGYSANYLKKKVIPQLWHLLSQTFEKKVTKANCGLILKERRGAISKTKVGPVKLESPEGPVSLGSPFYIERPVLEQSLYEEIQEPGAVISLKGPGKIGKSTLLTRILAHAETQHYHTVRLNLNRAGSTVLESPVRFFRWFCANVTLQLRLEASLEELGSYWHEELGVLTNCYLYFQNYLLAQISHPIVLGLDEVNRLESHPAIARDFLALLQSWCEEAKDCPVCQQLRIVACYSTNACIRSDLNKSPLNVGLVRELPPFTPLQVKDLAQRHQLPLSSQEFTQLQSFAGGFPYLTRKLFYQAALYELDWNELMASAATDTGIFSDHLQALLQVLQDFPDLLGAYRQVVTAETPIVLEQKQAFGLICLGLVRKEHNQVTASCQLYRQYFRDWL